MVRSFAPLYVNMISDPFEQEFAGPLPADETRPGERLLAPHGSTGKKRSFFPWQQSWANR